MRTHDDRRSRPLNELSAVELGRFHAEGGRAEAVVAACLERIDRREAAVGAWKFLDAGAARAAALACDASPARGPLHGVPVGVKDVIDTADMPTGYGSALYEGHRPGADAEAVRLLRDAGAIILGKTVSTEFAYFSAGKTSNPFDPARTPGGSSSGSAAAVGDDMVPLALGTQTAGSTIRPAAFCGVFGFKPSFGSMSTEGIRPLGPSLDTLGLFARTVDDLALLASVLSRGTIASTVEPPRPGPRIALASPGLFPGAEPATRELFVRIARLLETEGVLIVQAPLYDVAQLNDAQDRIMAVEAFTRHGNEVRANPGRISQAFAALCARGAVTPDAEYRSLLDRVASWRADFERQLEPFDFLLLPSSLGEAPLKTAGTGDPICSRALTMLGNPCITIPAGHGPNQLPLGVQLVTRQGADNDTLRWAKWLASLPGLGHARSMASTSR